MVRASAVETAKYVRAQTKELAQLSRAAGLEVLSFVLEMAAQEAEATIANSAKT